MTRSVNFGMRKAALAIAVVMFVAACGGSEEAVTEQAPAPSAPQATGPEAGAAQTLEELAMNPSPERNQILYEAAIANGGEILLYVTQPPAEIEAQIAGFNALYPDISVEYYRGGSTGSLINRVLTESAAGRLRADVTQTNDHVAFVLDGQGLFLEFVSSEDQAYDPALRVARTVYPAYVNYWMFAYNTDRVDPSELPRTYADLLEPEWTGRFSVAAYSDWFFGMHDILGDSADEFFEQFATQAPLIAPQFTPALLPVIQGERDLTISTVSGVLRGQQSQGAPLEGYFPEDETVARTVPITVLRGGGNPEGGLLFAEYVLSVEGQQLLAERGRVPGHRGVDPDPIELRPERARLIDYSAFVPEEAEWEARMARGLGR